MPALNAMKARTKRRENEEDPFSLYVIIPIRP